MYSNVYKGGVGMENIHFSSIAKADQTLHEFNKINQSVLGITNKINEILSRNVIVNKDLFFNINKDLDFKSEKLSTNEISITFNNTKNLIQKNLESKPYEYDNETLLKVLKLRNKKIKTLSEKFDKESIEVALNIKNKIYKDILSDMNHHKNNYNNTLHKIHHIPMEISLNIDDKESSK